MEGSTHYRFYNLSFGLRLRPGTETCSCQIQCDWLPLNQKKEKKITLQKSLKRISSYLFWVGFGTLGGILLKLASVCLSGFLASPCKFLSVWEGGFCISNLLAWSSLRLMLSWEIDRDELRRSMSISAVRAAKDLECGVMSLSFCARRMIFSNVEVRWKVFSIIYTCFEGIF